LLIAATAPSAWDLFADLLGFEDVRAVEGALIFDPPGYSTHLP
jgi:hypothetical protein